MIRKLLKENKGTILALLFLTVVLVVGAIVFWNADDTIDTCSISLLAAPITNLFPVVVMVGICGVVMGFFFVLLIKRRMMFDGSTAFWCTQ